MKEENVTCIRRLLKLVLTYIIKAPRFFESDGGLFLKDALAVTNLLTKRLLPFLAKLLIFSLKFKFAIQAVYFYNELQWILRMSQ